MGPRMRGIAGSAGGVAAQFAGGAGALRRSAVLGGAPSAAAVAGGRGRDGRVPARAGDSRRTRAGAGNGGEHMEPFGAPLDLVYGTALRPSARAALPLARVVKGSAEPSRGRCGGSTSIRRTVGGCPGRR